MYHLPVPLFKTYIFRRSYLKQSRFFASAAPAGSSAKSCPRRGDTAQLLESNGWFLIPVEQAGWRRAALGQGVSSFISAFSLR